VVFVGSSGIHSGPLDADMWASFPFELLLTELTFLRYGSRCCTSPLILDKSPAFTLFPGTSGTTFFINLYACKHCSFSLDLGQVGGRICVITTVNSKPINLGKKSLSIGGPGNFTNPSQDLTPPKEHQEQEPIIKTAPNQERIEGKAIRCQQPQGSTNS